MGCGSSAAAVHSEAPLAREPLRATQRQQQRRPVYTEVVQCSGCGVHARVAFGVAFCDQCTTKLDIAAKIQQANSELQVYYELQIYYNKLYIIILGGDVLVVFCCFHFVFSISPMIMFFLSLFCYHHYQ